MAQWKRIIVSGSSAEVSNVRNSAVAANTVVIGGGFTADQSGVALNSGQLLIGSAGSSPVAAGLTSAAGSGSMKFGAGAGSLTVNVASDTITPFNLSGSFADTPSAGQIVKVGANGAFTFDDASSTLSAGKAIAVTNNEISASFDDSTIGVNGSNQLEVKDSGIAFAKLANAAGNTVVVRDSGDSGDLSAKALATTEILIGNGAGFTAASLSNDVTMANDGRVTIANDVVTNAKLANITRGSVKVGGNSNAPTDLDAKTAGQILIGDGTDINSVAVAGDATLNSAGELTIAADAITNAKLANMTRGTVKVGGGSNAPTDLDAKTSGQILVGDGTDVASVAVSGDISLASNGAVTIGANTVDGSKLTDSVVIAEDLTVTRNLIVQGTTTEVQTTNLAIKDPLILLNSGSATDNAANATNDAGILFAGMRIGTSTDEVTTNRGSALFVDNVSQRLSVLANGSFASSAITNLTAGAHIPLITTGSLTSFDQIGNLKVDASGNFFVYTE